MIIRISESKQLHNARRKIENKNKGRPTQNGFVYEKDLAFILFPDSEKEHAIVNMSNLSRGKSTSIKLYFLGIICGFFGVDYNFLLGHESKHDDAYNRLVLKQKTK